MSTFPDPFDPRATLGGYGVVIENPNPDVMATGVRVVTRILDDAGTELLVDSALLNAVLPDQRMAVGRTLVEPIEGPTQLEVAIEVSEWLEPASTEGRLAATAVVTEPEEAGGSVTRFNVISTWPDEEEGVDVTAIYRAADGRILGADYTSDRQGDPRRTRSRPDPTALPHPRPRHHRGLRRSGLCCPDHRLNPPGAPMRRILALVVCFAFLGAACGDEEPVRETTPDTSELDAVEVTAGEDGAAPTLTFEEPFSVDETTRKVITEGDGATIVRQRGGHLRLPVRERPRWDGDRQLVRRGAR